MPLPLLFPSPDDTFSFSAWDTSPETQYLSGRSYCPPLSTPPPFAHTSVLAFVNHWHPKWMFPGYKVSGIKTKIICKHPPNVWVFGTVLGTGAAQQARPTRPLSSWAHIQVWGDRVEFLSSREVQVKIEGDLQGRKWCVYVGVDRREWALSLVEEGTHLFCIW